MTKPNWVIEKEKNKRLEDKATFWIFGLHAVSAALNNQNRKKHKLMLTKNAASKLAATVEASGITPEIYDARKFSPPIGSSSVHQGAALEVGYLNWGSLDNLIMNCKTTVPLMILLDQVTDPHNIGAILRSAEVFGATAVVGTKLHSPSETGALAKSASGALERQPYIRIRNLAETILNLKKMGIFCIGLDGQAEFSLKQIKKESARPTALVLGAEGSGLRLRTKQVVDCLAKIPFYNNFGSLNVSNAAAVSLYELQGQCWNHV